MRHGIDLFGPSIGKGNVVFIHVVNDRVPLVFNNPHVMTVGREESMRERSRRFRQVRISYRVGAVEKRYNDRAQRANVISEARLNNPNREVLFFVSLLVCWIVDLVVVFVDIPLCALIVKHAGAAGDKR